MIYYIVCVLLLVIFNLWLRKIEVRGRKNIPKSNDGYIIAANHVSIIDPVAIGYAVWLVSRRAIYYIAKKELAANKLLKKLFQPCQVIFIERGQGDRSILNQVTALLKRNQIILIFPQESSIPKKQKVKSGLGLLAIFSQKPILPVKVKITGYQRKHGVLMMIWMLLKWIFGPGRITITFGLLMKFDNKATDRHKITNEVMEKINSL